MKLTSLITTATMLLLALSANVFAQEPSSIKNGCVSGNCINGFGKVIFENGDIYEGNWVNGKKEGKGTFTYTNIGIYTGQYANDVRSGKGKFSFLNGDIYEGSWVDDKIQGQGTYTFKSGETYIGQYANGKKNGKGKETLVNGGIYEGDFVNDYREGQGIFRFIDGAVYSGQFVNGRRNGYGKLYTKSTNTTQEGIWKDDVLVNYTSAIDSASVKNGKLEDCKKSILSEGCRNYLLQSTASELLPQVKDSYILQGNTFVSYELSAKLVGGTDRIHSVEFERTSSNQYKPSENLKWGESLKKVKKKYGEPLQINVDDKKIFHSYRNFQLVYNLDNILCWITFARSKTESEIAAEQSFNREKLEAERIAKLEAERIANTPEAKEARIKKFFIASKELDSKLDEYTAKINKLIKEHNDYVAKYGESVDSRSIGYKVGSLSFDAIRLIDSFLYIYPDQITPTMRATLLESRKNFAAAN